MSGKFTLDTVQCVTRNRKKVVLTAVVFLAYLLAQWFSARASGAGGLRFNTWIGQSSTVPPTTSHRCDVPSKLCIAQAPGRGDDPATLTRFGEISRV